jgi:hypothetical protein
MKHKHAELIKAWADGAKIERRISKITWIDSECPGWYDDEEYRIKPEPKPDVVRFGYISRPNMQSIILTSSPFEIDNVKFTFDGETGKLKNAEVIK